MDKIEEHGYVEIGIYADWLTVVSDFQLIGGEGSMLQNYMEWQDLENVGMFAGFTCNTLGS